MVTLFFSEFFQSSFSDGKFIPSHLYLFVKGLIFVILSAYWKHLLSFLLIGFIIAFCYLSNQENLYVIRHNSDLFYDIYNRIIKNNQRQTNYLRFQIDKSIPNYFWYLFLSESKSPSTTYQLHHSSWFQCYRFFNGLYALHHYLLKN